MRVSEQDIDRLMTIALRARAAAYVPYSNFAVGAAVLTSKGNIFSGRGEGKYYVSQPGYLESFRAKLGFEPFHGTLNVKIKSNYVDHLELIRGSWPIIIEGFKSEERPFDAVLCYPLRIVGLDAKVVGIMPRRTHHPTNVLELISKLNLRETLNLKDEDEIVIEFPLEHKEGSA